MSLQYLGLSEINGPLVFLGSCARRAGYDEMVELRCEDGTPVWDVSFSWKGNGQPSRYSRVPTACP